MKYAYKNGKILNGTKDKIGRADLKKSQRLSRKKPDFPAIRR